jgi:glyoxylase-like metal-dependent hydrolase (beta-lactamase superfamily II)
VIGFIAAQSLQLDWILETHVHADHLSEAQVLRDHCGGRVAIGANVVKVQRHVAHLFDTEGYFASGAQPFDHLFADAERFAVAGLQGQVLFTPGHTPDGATYLIGDAPFIGDTLFMPDGGVARCDFPGGDGQCCTARSNASWRCPRRRGSSSSTTTAPGGREPRWESSIAEQRAHNIHWAGLDAADFIAKRRARDQTLEPPTLIIPAVQVNIRAGHLPRPEANGVRYLKLPLDSF